MEKVFLVRDVRTDKSTQGVLIAKGKTFYTLELPWRDNQRRVSCIPAGEYICEFLPRSASGKYKNVYHIKDVPGRDGILMHSGNVVKHSLGCPLIGQYRGFLGGLVAVLRSRLALKAFVKLMGRKSFKLVVIDG